MKKTAMAGIGLSVFMSGNSAWAFSPNETVNVAIIGTGGRSYALIKALSFNKNNKVTVACDVDRERLDKFVTEAENNFGFKIKKEGDFRKILSNKDIDAVFIVTPEHWHAPMAIMSMQAGKHVYVEKPCSHNLAENNLLVAAQQQYGKVCQMGNQQRSSVTSSEAVNKINDGIIGKAYFARAWYANTRGSIGIGEKITVPSTLNWDLWQGPAPRQEYYNNIHPYHWHWFKKWGTGEIHNNGTHEIDICRWALGVNYPNRVVSTGGRYAFNDDWEFYDTQNVEFDFDDKTIAWEGRSCNGKKLFNRDRGAIVYGTEGSVILDRAGYEIFDLAGNLKDTATEGSGSAATSSADTTGFDTLTVAHVGNFLSAIRESLPLNAPIVDASISTHLCHLGNIAQELKSTLKVDVNSGDVLDNDRASNLWSREYENGWEPSID
ncbi:Gfo/Idh/MocA family protein [Marinigracilibium pacificum]|uniref:Gfo/Idh/MocA family protein n=1 Tax=Marinigracilibium pacificum TaxID=2729599 RepID=UPI002FE38421